MNIRATMAFLGICLIAAALYGVGVIREPSVKPAPGSTLKITTSFYPLFFFTKEIAGEHADVANLTPAGAEPHEYEPTSQDMVRLEESQIVVANGIVEPWLAKMREGFAERRVTLVATAEGLASRQMTEANNHVAQDPHIWLSPRLAKQMVGRIKAALSQQDPAHAADYEAHAEDLTRRLTELDEHFSKGLQSCAQKSFVTAHAAFGYLADDYGLTQISIAGLSPEAEPSPQTLGEIATVAKAARVKYIFFEPSTSARLSETLAHELGAQTLVLNPLEGLTSEDIAAGKTYFTEMEQNLAHLRLALACPTPS